MSFLFFCIGGGLFALYITFAIWNIKSPIEKKKTDWPTYGAEGCQSPMSESESTGL